MKHRKQFSCSSEPEGKSRIFEIDPPLPIFRGHTRNREAVARQFLRQELSQSFPIEPGIDQLVFVGLRRKRCRDEFEMRSHFAAAIFLIRH